MPKALATALAYPKALSTKMGKRTRQRDRTRESKICVLGVGMQVGRVEEDFF